MFQVNNCTTIITSKLQITNRDNTQEKKCFRNVGMSIQSNQICCKMLTFNCLALYGFLQTFDITLFSCLDFQYAFHILLQIEKVQSGLSHLIFPLKCTLNGILNSTFTQILFFAIFTSITIFIGIHASFHAFSTCFFITIVRVFLITKLITVRILKQFKMSSIRRIDLLNLNHGF